MAIVTNEIELRRELGLQSVGSEISYDGSAPLEPKGVADLNGNRITLTQPLDLTQVITGGGNEHKLVIKNGQLWSNTFTEPMITFVGGAPGQQLVVWEASVTLKDLYLRKFNAADTEACLFLDSCGKEVELDNVKVMHTNDGILTNGGDGVLIRSWDGGQIKNLSAYLCKGAGVRIERMHIADTEITARLCGIGIVADGVRGGKHVWYPESNKGNGVDFLNCKDVDIDAWLENNNDPGTSVGVVRTQASMARCENTRMISTTSIRANQIDADRGSLYAALPDEHAVTVDFTYSGSDADLTDHDWALRWPDAYFRPQLTFACSDVLLNIPAGAFTDSSQNTGFDASWKPFEVLARAAQVGNAQPTDTLMEYKIDYRITNMDSTISDWVDAIEAMGQAAYIFAANFNGFGITWSSEHRGTNIGMPRSRGVVHSLIGRAWLPEQAASVGSLYINPGRFELVGIGAPANPRIEVCMAFQSREVRPT